MVHKINITYHENTENENIYNLVPKAPEVLTKPKRYSSIYSGKVREEIKRCKSGHKTMGFSKTPLDPPSEFLKKNSLRSSLPSSAKAQRYCSLDGRRPSLPHSTTRPATCGVQRNFVYENAQKLHSSTSTRAKNISHPYCVEPRYKFKKDYGMIPKYISQFVDEMKKRKIEEDNKENSDSSQLRQLSAEERDQILQGLKRNLGELQCQYLNLSVIIDTPSKKHRKALLEYQINQLEKDINMLERHPTIMVMKMD